jgi:hypothetical protein
MSDAKANPKPNERRPLQVVVRWDRDKLRFHIESNVPLAPNATAGQQLAQLFETIPSDKLDEGRALIAVEHILKIIKRQIRGLSREDGKDPIVQAGRRDLTSMCDTLNDV